MFLLKKKIFFFYSKCFVIHLYVLFNFISNEIFSSTLRVPIYLINYMVYIYIYHGFYRSMDQSLRIITLYPKRRHQFREHK